MDLYSHLTKLNSSGKFPITTLFFCLVVSLTLIGLVSWSGWDIYNQTLKTRQDELKIHQLSGTIVYLDEVLTMSSRLAALTGDVFWEKRYHLHDPELTSAIEEFKQILQASSYSNRFLFLLKQTEDANNQLVEMEVKSFSLVREGKLETANSILYSREYEKQKQIYSKGIEDLINAVESNIRSKVDANSVYFLRFSLICGFFLLASWIAAWIILGSYSLRRKQVEEALVESEKRLQSVFNAALDSIIVIDDKNNIRMFNPAAEKLFGWSASEVKGKNLKMLMPDPDRSSHDNYIRRYVQTGEKKIIGLDREIQALRRDGTVFWAKLSVSEAFWGDRRVFIGTLLDITEKKKAQELILHAKEELEKKVKTRTRDLEEEKAITEALGFVAEGANERLIVDHAILICLDRVCSLIGWELGHAFEVDPSDHSKLISSELVYFQGHGDFETVKAILGSAPLGIGDCVPGMVLEKRKLIFTEELGKLISFPRKKLASELGFKMGLAFPILVGEEVVQVLEFFTTTQTRPGKKVLAALEKMGLILGRAVERHRMNQIKTEFMTMAAHELRTPTTIIRGYSELLHDRVGMASDKKNKFLSLVAQESKHLSSIVNDLFDVACIEAGEGFLISPKPGDIWALLKEELDHLRSGVSSHNFGLLPSGEPVEILFDRDKIRQVLRNLFSNAVKYSPGGGMIHAKLEYSENRVTCSISDEGIGISSDHTKRLFEKFFRGDQSGAIQGTGLGLPIVKYIIEAHHGAIWLESELGKGTTVFFSLPR